MEAVILNNSKDVYNFGIYMAGRPLSEHISEWLFKNGATKTEFINIKKEEFSEKEAEKILKEKREIILITKPIITDIPLKEAIYFHKKNKKTSTLIYNKEKFTGIYILSEGAISSYKSYFLNGYFSFITSAEEYISFHKKILKEEIDFKIASSFKERGVILGEDTLLEIGSVINPPVHIGNRTVIESGAKADSFSFIGEDCIISSCSKIEGSVIQKGCFIGENACIKNSVISSGTVIEKGAVVEDFCFIGKDSLIRENARLPERTVIGNEMSFKNKSEPIPSPFLFEKSEAIPRSIKPEDSVILGAVFSKLISSETIFISSDGTPCSNMLKQAVISGIMSSGGKPTDIGNTPKAALVFLTRHKSCCGIYISKKISFFGKDSFGLKEKEIKKIKENYPYMYFARKEKSRISPYVFSPSLKEVYYEKMLSLLIPSKGCLYFSSDGEEIMRYAHFLTEKTGRIPLSHRTGGYISGYFNTSGELTSLYNEDELPLSRKDILRLYINIIAKYEKKKVVLIEKEYYPELFCYAKKMGTEPLLTNGGDYLKALWEKGTATQYLMESDGVFSFLKIHSYLTREKLLLKDLLVF